MKAKLFLAIGLPALLLACGNAAPATTTQLKPSFDLDNATGHILVDLKDNSSDSDIKEIESKFGVSFFENNAVAHQYRYEEATVNWTNEEATLKALRTDPRVEHAEPMTEYRALFTPNDEKYDQQYGLKRVGGENVWNTTCGQGVVVAVLDTGVAVYDRDGHHKLSDFADMKVKEGYNTIDGTDFAYDVQSHGTFCAAEIAESTNNGHEGAGLANCASIMPVKVLSDGGSGTNENIAEGIRWAVDHGAQVISMSLGGPYPSDVLEDAVNYAHDSGTIVIAAAGNSGGSIGYPAAFKNAVAVSAIDANDNIADFSSRGPEVAIAAPGVKVCQQTVGEDGINETWACYSGTSMSAPFLSAAAAMLYAQGITDPDAVKAKLQATADPKDNKELYGAGILRADKAVQSTILSHTILRLIALFGVILFFGKTLKGQWKNRYSITGIIITAFGAFPLMFSGLLARMGSFRLIGDLLSHPLGEYDMVLGHGHSLLLLASIIPASIASVVMLKHPKLKLFATGMCMGSMALDMQYAFSGDTRFVFGSLVMRAFLVANIMVGGWFVKNLMTPQKA